jgi:hypothetical protein
MVHVGCLHRNWAKKQARQVRAGRDRMEEIAFRLAIMDPFLQWYNWCVLPQNLPSIRKIHLFSRQTKVSPRNASLCFFFELLANVDRAIVHRAGGMLLQSRKELLICADLTEKDVFFYYTTTCALESCSVLKTLIIPILSGWMMWNFLIGGLGICPIVLYDGSPLKRPAHLWNLVDELGITIFGTSAKYIDELSVRPQLARNVRTVDSLRCRKCTHLGNTTNSRPCATSIPRVLHFHPSCLTLFTNTSKRMSCWRPSQVNPSPFVYLDRP